MMLLQRKETIIKIFDVRYVKIKVDVILFLTSYKLEKVLKGHGFKCLNICMTI